MILRFCSGINDPGEAAEEALLGVHGDEVDVQGGGEAALDVLGLALAEQAVVDEDADELVADGLVHERGNGAAINAAGQAADDFAGPDLRADEPHLLLDEALHVPQAPRPADLLDEAPDDLGAPGGVDDLGVELDGIEAALGVVHGRAGAVVGGGGDGEAGGRGLHGVAVAHPADKLRVQALEQDRGVQHVQPRLAELFQGCRRDLAAQVVRHRLHPVADAENRQAEVIDGSVYLRCPLVIDGRRTAGQDQADRITRLDDVQGRVVGQDLAVDVAFPDAPGDELGVLRPEV